MENELSKDILNKEIDQDLYKYKQNIMRNNPPEQIIKMSYEIAVKEQIADEIKSRDLEQTEIKALLKEDNLLDDFYAEWMKEDTRLGEILENSIDEKLGSLVDEFEKNIKKKR